MVVRLYCAFDRVAQLCGPVVDSVNDGVALRQFTAALKDNPNKADFQLLFVGTFDQAKGVLTPADPLPVAVEVGAPIESEGQTVEVGNGKR